MQLSLVPALAATIAFWSVLSLGGRAALAQQHVDGAIEAGVAEHLLTTRPSSMTDTGPNASPGPQVRATGHLAIFPLVRAGFGLQLGYSPVATGDRVEFGGGLDLRGIVPLRIADVRPYLGLGLNYLRIARPGTSGAGGGRFTVPVFVGAMYKFRRPYEIGANLGVDLGFGWHGPGYREPLSQGHDAATVWLSLALGFDN